MSLYKVFSFWFFLSVMLVSCGGGSGSSIVYLPPSYNADYSDISVTEGVKNIISLIAIDTNNRPVTHTITGGDDEELFSLTSNGQLVLLKAADFELPHDLDGDNVYKVSVQASAGTDITSMDISISIQDALEGRVVDGPIIGAFVFIDNDGDLVFDNIINKLMPNTIGARHYDYIKIAGTNSLSVITTHTTTDTESNRNENSKIPPGELNLIQDINAENNREFYFY